MHYNLLSYLESQIFAAYKCETIAQQLWSELVPYNLGDNNYYGRDTICFPKPKTALSTLNKLDDWSADELMT